MSECTHEELEEDISGTGLYSRTVGMKCVKCGLKWIKNTHYVKEKGV